MHDTTCYAGQEFLRSSPVVFGRYSRIFVDCLVSQIEVKSAHPFDNGLSDEGICMSANLITAMQIKRELAEQGGQDFP